MNDYVEKIEMWTECYSSKIILGRFVPRTDMYPPWLLRATHNILVYIKFKKKHWISAFNFDVVSRRLADWSNVGKKVQDRMAISDSDKALENSRGQNKSYFRFYHVLRKTCRIFGWAITFRDRGGGVQSNPRTRISTVVLVSSNQSITLRERWNESFTPHHNDREVDARSGIWESFREQTMSTPTKAMSARTCECAHSGE